MVGRTLNRPAVCIALLTAAFALTLSLGAYCALDAAFIFAFEDVKKYPRRFPADAAFAAAAVPALTAELYLMRRRGRGALISAVGGIVLAVPALFLWERLSTLL